ncbi:MAG: MCE family protein [Cyclobacteriaceae bacterium]|nr:MCE family protein [Cyclobacteriaceae bacterium]
MRVSKEFKVGLLSVVSIAILYFGFNYLKGIDFLSKTNTYYAIYENTGGLGISNSVIINGLNVGRVSNIDLMQDRQNAILVQIDVERSVKMGKNTIAHLINTDFLGSKAIELEVDYDFSRLLQKGDTLSSYTEAGITEFLKEKGAPVAEELGVTIQNLNLLLNDFSRKSEEINPAIGDFVETMASVKTLVADNQQSVKIMLNNINKTSNNLNEILEGLKPLVEKAGQVADTLNLEIIHASLDETRKLLGNLNETIGGINDGEGSAGKLLQDDSLYLHLNNAARDLDLLLIDLRERPKRYVHFSLFGRRDKDTKNKKE